MMPEIWAAPPLRSNNPVRGALLKMPLCGFLLGDDQPWMLPEPDLLILPSEREAVALDVSTLGSDLQGAGLLREALESRNSRREDVISAARRLGAGPPRALNQGHYRAESLRGAITLAHHPAHLAEAADHLLALFLSLSTDRSHEERTYLIGTPALDWEPPALECALPGSGARLSSQSLTLGWRWLEAVIPGGGVRRAMPVRVGLRAPPSWLGSLWCSEVLYQCVGGLKRWGQVRG